MRNPGSWLFLTLPFASASLIALPLSAQSPALAPTSDATIVVPTGGLHYSSISIPAGVTVRFVTPVVWPIPFVPALIYCDGDATVFGTISVGGEIRNGYGTPAGWVTTGAGLAGARCGSGANAQYSPPQGGQHAGTYGAVVPFSLEGGSEGGLLSILDQNCMVWQYNLSGGPAGGTLALLAGGRIDIHGTVTADGLHFSVSSGGSGGSILLRGEGGVSVWPNASVTARGGTNIPAPHPYTVGADGYVRLDAWGAPPVIQGTVAPQPTVLELPHLRAPSPPQIGTTWQVEVFAPAGAPTLVAVSLAPGPGTATPFGPLGIDPTLSTGLGLTSPQPSHDPFVSVPLAVPNAPVLIGLGLWAQAIVAPPNLPARLSNTIAATVQ